MPEVHPLHNEVMSKKDMQALKDAKDLQEELKQSVTTACRTRQVTFDEAVEHRDIETCWAETSEIVHECTSALLPRLRKRRACWNGRALEKCLDDCA